MSATYRWVLCVLLASSACIGDEPTPKYLDAGNGEAYGNAGKGGSGGKSSAGKGGAAGGSARGGTSGSGGRASPPTDGGADSSIPVGTACEVQTDCASSHICSALAYCSMTCTSDTACGQSPAGRKNFCEPDGTGTKYCFAGCNADADCAQYSGAGCRSLPDGRGKSCTFVSNSSIGGPCDTSGDCSEGLACIAGPGGWCSPSTCSSDRDCGVSVDGIQNRCVVNNLGNSICFPGCVSEPDCSYFLDSVCVASAEGAGKSCSIIPIGGACATDADCGSTQSCAGSPESPGWCTATCASHNDCGYSPFGYSNLCLETVSGNELCFPGCESNEDCAIYADTVCVAEGVCSSSDD